MFCSFWVLWFSGLGRASQSASAPGHPLSQLALPAGLGSQQEAQPTSTKSVKLKKQKTKKPTHVQKLGSCSIFSLMDTFLFGLLVFRGWPGQPVGQSAWPSTQPTGLASQLGQSARSTAHFYKICKTKKTENHKTTKYTWM